MKFSRAYIWGTDMVSLCTKQLLRSLNPSSMTCATMFEDVSAVEEDTLKTPVFKPSAVNDYKVDWSEMVREERQREEEYKARQEPCSVREGNIDVSSFKIIGQLANTYILVQHSGGLLIVDQHVAHERVHCGPLQKKGRGEGCRSTAVANSTACRPWTPGCVRRLWNTPTSLRRWAFSSTSSAEILCVERGAMIPGTRTSPDEMFRETVCGLEDVPKGSEDRVIYDKIVVTASCKAAVKAGMPLEPDMMSKLMKDLFKTSAPFNCPHGTPNNTQLEL